ncbi:MAG: SUMF1/EgtB/PvdO family nonheme iron enzyme [Planctomycetes bacterium]|nr:SUMF1/EgtB/PvdO family nonheme iron enzyme [Planctomycetota bacterium]
MTLPTGCQGRRRGRALARFAASASLAGAAALAGCLYDAVNVYAPPPGAGALVDRGLVMEVEAPPDGLKPDGVGGGALNSAGFREFLRLCDNMRVIYVPAGSVTIGDDGAGEAERPAHERFVGGFFIDRYEVSNEQYAAFLAALETAPDPALYDHPEQPPRADHRPDSWTAGADPAADPDQRRRPVTGLDWYDAFAYARWACGRTDRACLPTEFEWETAARGHAGARFPWGDFPPDRSRANFDDDTLPQNNALQAVGEARAGASPFGLEDLLGNVAEFTATPFRRDHRFGPDVAFPHDMTLRGGGFRDVAADLRPTRRTPVHRETRADDIGFRCVFRHHRVPEDETPRAAEVLAAARAPTIRTQPPKASRGWAPRAEETPDSTPPAPAAEVGPSPWAARETGAGPAEPPAPMSAAEARRLRDRLDAWLAWIAAEERRRDDAANRPATPEEGVPAPAAQPQAPASGAGPPTMEP